jgi:BON domain
MHIPKRILPVFAAPCALLLAAVLTPGASAGPVDFTDLHHEVLVRTVFAEDARLEPLNIIVRVHDHVATLSGPVPTRELAQRAIAEAKKVPEIREVRDGMLVKNEDRGLSMPFAMKTTKVTPVKSPLTTVVRWEENATKTLQPPSVWRPAPAEPPLLPSRPDIGVLPSYLNQPPKADAVSRTKAAEPAPAAEFAEPKLLSLAVESIVVRQERYRGLHWEIKDGKAYLSGEVTTWQDLRELAKALRQIPGITEIELRDLRLR